MLAGAALKAPSGRRRSLSVENIFDIQGLA
jgi:hypothetical protein